MAALKERRKGSGTGMGGEEGGRRSQQRPVIQGFTVQGKGWNFIPIVKVEGAYWSRNTNVKHLCIIEERLYRTKGANTKSNHEALAMDGERCTRLGQRRQK